MIGKEFLETPGVTSSLTLWTTIDGKVGDPVSTDLVSNWGLVRSGWVVQTLFLKLPLGQSQSTPLDITNPDSGHVRFLPSDFSDRPFVLVGGRLDPVKDYSKTKETLDLPEKRFSRPSKKTPVTKSLCLHVFVVGPSNKDTTVESKGRLLRQLFHTRTVFLPLQIVRGVTSTTFRHPI